MLSGVESETVVVMGVLALGGLFTGWLGYRIRYRSDVSLIAGYDDEISADAEALSRVIGRVVLAVAAITVLSGLLYPVVEGGPIDAGLYWVGYTVIIVVLSGYAVFASQRYVSES
jgi:cytochrome c biogenesis factor